MSVKTQGTHLFFVNTVTSIATVVKMECPTGITGATSGQRTQIDTTCLDATEDMSYTSGLGQPSQLTVPFIMDPQADSHQQLFELKASGITIPWLACLSDGTSTPTLDSDAKFEIPTERSSLLFNAYVADVNLDIATNEVVRGTLTLQRSGSVTLTAKQVQS